MKQGNPTKKIGRIAMLMGIIDGLFNSSSTQRVEAMKEKNNLILNSFGPAPLLSS